MRQWAWLLAGLVAGCIGPPREPVRPTTGTTTVPPPPGPTKSADTAKPAAPPCSLPAEVRVSLRDGRILLNGSDMGALADTPELEDCPGQQHQYTFDLDPDARAQATWELLEHVPRHADGVELLAFPKSPPIAVLRAARTRASGHWVKLRVDPHHVSVVELRRDESQLKAAPTVASERKVQKLSEAYAWLHSTCGKEPCAGVILVLSPEQTNGVIASALQAISTPNAPTPLIEIRKDDEDDSNELPKFGRLPPEQIQDVVVKAYGDFRKCYTDGLGRNAKLVGRVSVKFVIDIDGSVKSNALAASDMPDAEVARCIVARFATLHFPSPDGGIVTVVYPIMLSPG
jgi:hypothetical protein